MSNNGTNRARKLVLLAVAALISIACSLLPQFFRPVSVPVLLLELIQERHRQVCGRVGYADGARAPIVGTADSLQFLFSHYVRPVVTATPSKRATHRTSLCGIYSVTYEEARNRFRAAVLALQDESQNRQVNVTLHTFPLPPVSLGHARDSVVLRDDDLTIDVAVIRPPKSIDGAGYVIHTSGLHGAEGYAGSSIQVGFLQLLSRFGYEQVVGPKESLHPTIILVHTMNPFGMKYNRRFNERNIDLNRNGLFPRDVKEIGKEGTAHHNYLAYKELDTSLFNPPAVLSGFEASTLSYWSLVKDYYAMSIQCFSQAFLSVVRVGYLKMKESMVGAQYHNPMGVFFGGTPDEPTEPSLTLVRDFLQGELARTDHKVVGAVTWIDVHTGLGPKGVDTLLVPSGNVSSVWPARDAATELSTWFPYTISQFASSAKNETHAERTDSGKVVFKGWEKAVGVAADYFEALFTAKNKPLVMVQEFGTVPSVIVGHSLIAENYMYRKYILGPMDADSPPSSNFIDRWQYWTHRTTRAAFDPNDDAFRYSVVSRGLQLLSQAIVRSSVLSSSEDNGGATKTTARQTSPPGDEL
jgi:Protein of unknown function (DUF2817)